MTKSNIQALIAAKGSHDTLNAIYNQYQISENPVEQFEWARQAAFLGASDAINFLIKAYQDGDGTERDSRKVFEWLKKGAEGSDGTKFYFELAQAYRNGCGTEVNLNEFWIWMTKAADDNDKEAMFQLAKAHRDESLGQHSPEKSLEWTKKMAEAGSPSAMIELAKHYKDSNLDEAKRWAEKAVEKSKELWDIEKNKIGSKQDVEPEDVPPDENIDDFVLNDYPKALEILSETLSMQEKNQEVEVIDEKIVDLLREVIFFVEKNKEYELDFSIPECLAKILKKISEKGEIESDLHQRYLKCFEVFEKALGVFKGGSKFKDLCQDQIPLSIPSVIYSTAKLKEKSEKMKLLELAVDFGCSTSAYDLAILFLEDQEYERFGFFIGRAAELNSMNAIITQSLMNVMDLGGDFLNIQSLLINLWDKICEIKDEMHALESADDDNVVAHYTDEFALVNMLSNKNCIRLYNIAYMNDPNEGKRLQSYKNDNPLNKILPKEDDISSLSWRGKNFHIFIGCFSLESDKLNLWRFYGRDGKGFSVTTPLLSFNSKKKESMMNGLWSAKKDESSITLYKILYSDSEVESTLEALKDPINNLIDEIEELGQKNEILEIAAMIVRDLLYLYKLEDYKDEKEVRVIEARALGDSEIKSQPNGQSKFSKLYIETPAILFQSKGSKIIIGPKVENAGIAMVDIRHQLAAKEWSGECIVEQSKVPYR